MPLWAAQALAIEEQFTTVQEEVEIKTKKLKKLWAKFQESESNLAEERKAFQVSGARGSSGALPMALFSAPASPALLPGCKACSPCEQTSRLPDPLHSSLDWQWPGAGGERGHAGDHP